MYLILTISWNMIFSCSMAAFFSLWRHIIWNLDHNVVCSKLYWIYYQLEGLFWKEARSPWHNYKSRKHFCSSETDMTSHTEHTLKQVCQVLKAVSILCGTWTERLHPPTETSWTSATRASTDEKEEPCWAQATWEYPESPCVHLPVYGILLGTNWYLKLCKGMNIFTVKKGWINCFSQIHAINCFFLHLLHLFFWWVLQYSQNI